MALYNVGEATGALQVHGVHIHLGEEWSWGCDSRRDHDLVGLSNLAYVARVYISGDVAAHERPPVLLHDEGM